MSTTAGTEGVPRQRAVREERAETVLEVFDAAFGELLARDPAAFRVKFRKMAGSAFAFYRGTACLFYADAQRAGGAGRRFLDERTSRVWIHGDLHAENFGTYMAANGRLVFNVNDFDEAYVGPYLWDLQRFAASTALIGYAKALADDTISELVRTYALAYRERIRVLASDDTDSVFPLTLDRARGPLLAALRSARMRTRFGLLAEMTEIHGYERRFTSGGGAVELDRETKEKVLAAFEKYLETLPADSRSKPDSLRVKDVVGRRGVGIGSAGLPSYNVLLEGNTDALENDVVIYLKQGQTPAVSAHVTDRAVRDYFHHEGHRTVISQRALQAHADPWLGWTELDGAGQLVAEVSPYAVDLDWSDIDDPEEIAGVVADLGRATATMHAAADDESGHSLVPFSTEDAIDAVIGDATEDFAGELVEFAHTYGARARADHQLFVDLFRNGRIPGL